KRQRLSFSCLWGAIDQQTHRELLHVVHCFNERCVSHREAQLDLRRRLGWGGVGSAGPGLAATAVPATAPRIALPENCIPINSAAAVKGSQYVESRGFDVDELATRWAVQYTQRSDDPPPSITSRVVIPIYTVRTTIERNERTVTLAGWQARRIEDSEDDEEPKYTSSRGLRK